uniref:Uncharacterized protein n=1 Tax=Odontella aurita TaxID=265563 RepID=A0A7S4JSH3_9STRA|mmetsp:Transcript_53104/g.158914  ORF Transcript_53104/g.158914 Transcript_53104/m.158914 type:complete len:1849 (+) Transcript_53104:118-5664(+)
MAKVEAVPKMSASKRRRSRVSFSDNASSCRERPQKRSSYGPLLLSDFRSTIQRLRPSLTKPDRCESYNTSVSRPWYDDGSVAEGRRNSAAAELARSLGDFLVSIEGAIDDEITMAAGKEKHKKRKIKSGDDCSTENAEWRQLAKEALSILLCERGPGDTHFRSAVLVTIPLLKLGSTTQILLDALPFCIVSRTCIDGGQALSKDGAESNIGIGSAEDEIIDVLRPLLLRKHLKTLPVLVALARLMPSFDHTNHRSEAFELILEAFALVPWTELVDALEPVLLCVKSEGDGERVVLILRKKWSQETNTVTVSHGNRGIMRAATLLFEKVWAVLFVGQPNAAFFRAGYVTALNNVAAELDTRGASGTIKQKSTVTREKDAKLIMLDLFAILVLQQAPEYRVSILSIVDTLLLKNHFPLDVWQDLMQMMMAKKKRRNGGSGLEKSVFKELDRSVVITAAMQLVLCFLLLPYRCSRNCHIDIRGLTYAVDSMASCIFDVLTAKQREDFVGSFVNLGSDGFVDSASIRPTSTNGHSHSSALEDCPASESKRKSSRPSSTQSCYQIHFAIPFAQSQLLALPILRSLCRKPDGLKELCCYGRVFVDRLISFPRSGIFIQLEEHKNGSSDGDDGCCPYALIDITCAVVVSLLGDATSPLTTANVLGLVETFLFSPSCATNSSCFEGRDSHSEFSHWRNENTGQVISGLLLSKQLLLSHKLHDKEREVLMRWIARTVLPPSPKSRALPSPKRGLDPEVGLWGLQILLKLAMQSIDPGKGQRKNGRSASLVGNVQHLIKTHVARTGLVILETSPSFSNAPKSNILWLHEKGTQDSGKKGMIFQTSEYALPGMKSPLNVIRATQFVFRLIDVYLGNGRREAADRWSPNGWLWATVALPNFLPYPQNREEINLSADAKNPKNIAPLQSEDCQGSLSILMHRIFGRDAIDLAIPGPSTKEFDGLLDLFLALPAMHQKSHVDALTAHANGAAVAIGICNAVLKNVYEHHLVTSTPGSKQCLALLRMIHLQLRKIYNLRQRLMQCLNVLALLGDGSTTKRDELWKQHMHEGNSQRVTVPGCSRNRHGSQKGNKKEAMKQVIRNGANNIAHKLPPSAGHVAPLQWVAICRDSFSHLFSSPGFISTSILWTCLLETASDMTLDCMASTKVPHTNDVDTANCSKNCESSKNKYCTDQERNDRLVEDVLQIIAFKCFVARHLSDVLDALRQNCVFNQSHCNEEKLLPYFPEWSTISSLSSSSSNIVLQVLRTTQSLVKTAGILSVLRDRLSKSLAPSTAKDAVDPISSCGKNNRISLTAIDGTLYEYYNLLYKVLCHFSDRYAPKTAIAVENCPEMKTECGHLASQLSESVNAIHRCQIIDILSVLPSVTLLEACLKLTTELSWRHLQSAFHVSMDFAKRNTSYCDDTLRVRQVPHAFVCARNTLLSMPAPAAEEKEHRALKSIALSAINRISNSSSWALQSSAVLRHGMLAQWSLLVLGKEGSYELCEKLKMLFVSLSLFLEKKSRRGKNTVNEPLHSDRRKTLVVPGLTNTSYPVFLEILLHMIIASFSLETPSLSAKSKDQYLLSPYKRIEDISKLFNQVIGLFVKFDFFPRRMLPCILRGSLLMLKASRHQIRSCVDWQSHQPLNVPHDQKHGVDTASVALLYPLIKVVSECTQQTLLLCNFARKEIDKFCSNAKGAMQRTAQNLTKRCEKFLEYLQTVCVSHNLLPRELNTSLHSGLESGKQNSGESDISNQMNKHYHAVEIGSRHLVSPASHAGAVYQSDALMTPEIRRAPHPTDAGEVKIHGALSGQTELPTNAKYDSDRTYDHEDDSGSEHSYGVYGDWCDDTATVDASIHSLELKVHR